MQENNICQCLIELRKFHGYSQKDVASYLHIARPTYSHYETGRVIPPTNAIYHLARLYRIPSDFFLELIDGSVSNDGSEQADLKSLSGKEWQMLSHYSLMDEHEQNKVLHFFEEKCQNHKEPKGLV